MFSTLLIVVSSYLLGSIPFGYLLVRIFRGEDVRRSGSGNIGATNVARKAPVLGAITLLLDAAKGAGAVLLADTLIRLQSMGWTYSDVSWYAMSEPLSQATRSRLMTRYALAALFAIIGHMFPVWLKFRGGKGVATALGSFGLIAPKAVLVAAGIFLLAVLISRYVSLGSIIAVASFPVLTWAFHEYGSAPAALAFMVLSSLLIIARHHANIRRLLAGTENGLGSKSGTKNIPPPRPENS
jgi:acyl phosphate:glycerol-3-phosphate acyltransferase